MPTGAGNDFARGLGYDPKHPLDAFDALAHGHDRVVDLGRVNGRWYTCVTASGFDAEANRWANTVHRLSGTTLYVAAVLRTLAVYKPHPFRLTVDGETHELTRLARRGRQRPGVRRRHEHRADARASTTACSTSPSSARCHALQLLVNFPKVFKGTHVVAPEGHDLPRRARRARVARPVGADGGLRRRRTRRAAARRRWKPCATR